MSIRKAEARDVSAMLELSEAKRRQYEVYQPIFHKKAADSAEKQKPFLEGQVAAERNIALVSETGGAIQGFVIGAVIQAPPVYQPGGPVLLVDDFMVREPGLWATVGHDLLTEATRLAREQGAVLVNVVCGPRDEPKRAMLGSLKFDVATEWHVLGLK